MGERDFLLSFKNVGLEFGIERKNDIDSILLYSAQQALKMRREYEKIYSDPDVDGIIDRIWLIGTNANMPVLQLY